MQRSMKSTFAAVVVAAVVGLSVPVVAQKSHMRSSGMMQNGVMQSGMMQSGMMQNGMMHNGMMKGMDMPMLNGRNTTRAEVEEMRVMFQNHPDITRSVTNLPDGIETRTESTDSDLAAAIVGHVVKMAERIEEGRDPMVPIQSPTLRILFERGDRIATEMTPTDNGIVVRQTSTDPEVVAALQKHAGEVSDLAARGMAAVHDGMMQRHMRGGSAGRRGMMHGMFTHH